MKALENRIPPVLAVIIFGFLMWLFPGGSMTSSQPGVARTIFMVLTLIAGIFFCFAGVQAFRSAKTTVNPLQPDSASSLVTTGVYRFTRNPMYLGFALLLVAWTLLLGSMGSVLGVAGFVIFITRFQIIPEERAMHSLFGQAYSEYAEKVHRWIPIVWR